MALGRLKDPTWCRHCPAGQHRQVVPPAPPLPKLLEVPKGDHVREEPVKAGCVACRKIKGFFTRLFG